MCCFEKKLGWVGVVVVVVVLCGGGWGWDGLGFGEIGWGCCRELEC